MSFEKIALEYYNTFDEYPPMLTTLDVENEEYLKVLQKAIDDMTPIDRNDLGEIFMTDDEAMY